MLPINCTYPKGAFGFLVKCIVHGPLMESIKDCSDSRKIVCINFFSFFVKANFLPKNSGGGGDIIAFNSRVETDNKYVGKLIVGTNGVEMVGKVYKTKTRFK